MTETYTFTADEWVEKRDEILTEGERIVWRSILRECLVNLGYEGTEAQHTKWISEREAAVSALRRVCEDFGRNDWPPDLHLADVINKYLADVLYSNEPGGWIPVGERLPDKDGRYLVWDGAEVMTADYWPDAGIDFSAGHFTVTHWQPLPERPE
jgi:hypothetical protein